MTAGRRREPLVDNFCATEPLDATIAAMSFEDLPRDWATRPLTDPALVRDVLDLFVSRSDRETGGLALLLCSLAGRLRQPMFIKGLNLAAIREQREEAIDWVIQMCEEVDDGASPLAVVLATVHAKGHPSDDDRAWHQCAIDRCRTAGIELLSMHVVLANDVVTLPSARKAA